MRSATLTSQGQITVPRDVRKRLGLDSGDKIEFVEIEQGLFAIRPVIEDVRSLKGLLKKPDKSVSVQDMNEAIYARAARR